MGMGIGVRAGGVVGKRGGGRDDGGGVQADVQQLAVAGALCMKAISKAPTRVTQDWPLIVSMPFHAVRVFTHRLRKLTSLSCLQALRSHLRKVPL